jgi:hypothetical protein
MPKAEAGVGAAALAAGAEVVPVEAALVRAVRPEQAAAIRVLPPTQQPILEAQQGVAPILGVWAIRTPTRIPGALTTLTARMTGQIKIAHIVAAEGGKATTPTLIGHALLGWWRPRRKIA